MELVKDNENRIYDWVVSGLNKTEGTGDYPNTLTIGVREDNTIFAGVVYSKVGNVVYISIYAEHPKWCTPGILTRIFKVGFALGGICKAATDAENNKINRLMKGLGLVKEGVLRRGRENGHDEIIWSLTEEEFATKRWNNVRSC